MLRLASDENVNDDVITGLLRRVPGLDIVRIRDVGLAHTPDPRVLEWAAHEGRVIITEDVNTLVGFAWERVGAGQPMPGVLALKAGFGIGQAIDDILLVADCYIADEVKNQVYYIPL